MRRVKENNSNSDIRAETKESQEEYERNLKKLWDVIKRSGPEKRAMIIGNLDKKAINTLRTVANPYKKPIIAGNKCRYLAFNAINLTEKYSQRFAMTSLIGFVYRMLDEYSPEDLGFISENDASFANLYNEQVRNLILSKPEEELFKKLTELKTEIVSLSKNLDLDSKTLLKAKVKESFVVRSKIIKYKVYLIKEDHKNLKTKKESLDRDIRNLESNINGLHDTIRIVNIKIEKKKKYDSRKENLKENREIEESNPHLDLKEETDLNVLTTTEALSRNLDSFKKELANKEKTIEILSLEKANKSSSSNELHINMQKMETEMEALNSRFKLLKEEYDQKMVKNYKPHLSSKTKNIHFLDNVEIDKYEPTGEELDLIAEKVKKELNIEKTSEEHNEDTQNIIQKFLDKYFRYNPDLHVRCAYKPNYDDPSRVPLANETTVERTVIPPDDTFFRWNRYLENNYEPLRQATDDIYCEKSDFEWDLVPLEVFEGDTPDEVKEKFDSYKRKYAEEFESDIFGATFANHNLLSPWYQNNQIRDFYTEKTEIIKRILDQNAEDSRMGQKLMKGRAEQKKKEDIDKLGPDPASHKQFLEAHPPKELQKHGAVHMDDIETLDIIKASGVPNDMNESTQNEIEVGVHVIKPRGGKRRIRGFSEQWKFNIPSEELKPEQCQTQTPAEFQEKMLKQETNL